MKILYLFHFKIHNNYDHYLNIDFANIMKCHPDIELLGYGLDLTEHDNCFAPLKYQPNITLSDIYKGFQFDAIVVNTKGRCWEYYNPHTNDYRNMWLPKDFKNWDKTPKVIFEEDYHYEKDDSWYKEMNFDLILQRHYSQFLRQENVPMKFFPFSVDTSTFNPWKTETPHKGRALQLPNHYMRKNKIAFVGNDGDKAYKYRFWACRNLVDEGLCHNYSAVEPNAQRKIDGDYVKILREYKAHISCGSTFEICAAKNFEILASGSVLFTNKFTGIEKILPEDCYVSYENDWSDLKEKATRIIKDEDYCKQLVRNGLKLVNEKHTHNIRIEQLINIIKEIQCVKYI